MLDIHSHILFGVDDGAKSLEDSIALLNIMKNEDINKIIATPHFYPQDTNIDDFLNLVRKNFKTLKTVALRKGLPDVYLGCELLYFVGMGQSTSLSKLCLNNSNYLLLELTDNCINEKLFSDISALMNQSGIIPIIAHIERYSRAKNFKKLLSFTAENKIPVQINATSFLMRIFKSPIKKIIKSNLTVILGSDTHSVDVRPPRYREALSFIEKKYGTEFKTKLLHTSKYFENKIIG